MLPVELLERLVPKRGDVLLRRDARPKVAKGVWIPDCARTAARAATATVLRVSPEIRELAAGERVVLAATVGARSIRLVASPSGASGEEEQTVELCRVSQILGRILDVPDASATVENHGEHPLALFTPAQLHPEPEPLDEGDPLGVH